MSKKKIIIIVVIAVLIVGGLGYSFLSKNKAPTSELGYTETISTGFDKVVNGELRDTTYKLVLDASVNNGINEEIVFDVTAGSDAEATQVTVKKNGMSQTYSRVFIRQDGKLFLNIDSAMLILADTGVEIPLSDSDYTANLFVELPALTEQMQTGINTLREALISSRDKATANKENAGRGNNSYTFTRDEYLALLNEESSKKEQFFQIMTLGGRNTMSEDLKEMLEKQTEKNGQDSFVPLEDQFRRYLNIAEEVLDKQLNASVTETCSFGNDTFSFELVISEGETEYLRFSVVDAVSQKTALVRQLPGAQILNYASLYSKLAQEIDDLINNNYETDDVWDEFDITSTTLTLIRYGDGADQAIIYNFDSKGLKSMTMYFKTKSLDIHQALKNHYVSVGYNLVKDSEPEDGKTGRLDFETTSSSLYFDSASKCSTPGELYDLLVSVYSVKEASDNG